MRLGSISRPLRSFLRGTIRLSLSSLPPDGQRVLEARKMATVWSRFSLQHAESVEGSHGDHVFECTQRAIPASTRVMPTQVSINVSRSQTSLYSKYQPLDMTFPSAHHSPRTVNRKANELVMGTVRLNSDFNENVCYS